MNLVNKTGVPVKQPGDGLTAQEINAINSTVNSTVDVANSYLKNECNANEELGNMTQFLTLSEAIAIVPADRRTLGMTVRFWTSPGNWTEYSFIGDSVDNWNSASNWSMGTLIDGGEW